MRRMGVKGHPFDPMPPDQHKWQRAKGEDPLHRLWSWMTGHTVAFHHRSEYAVNDEGRELHLEHASKDLDMDLAQVYRVWNEGVSKGLWRNGTKEEGKRKLYLCGSVKPKPAPESAEDQNPKIDCTVNFPAQIRNIIKDWPKEQREKLAADIARVRAVQPDLTAVAVAAVRTLIALEEDKVYEGYGVKVIHQEHKKNGETADDVQARRARVQPLLPGLELIVQSISGSVQNGNSEVYNESVHAQNGAASLLHQSNSRTTPESSSSSPDSVGSSGRGETLSREEGKPAADLDPAPGAGLRLSEYFKVGIGKGPAAKPLKEDRPILAALHKIIPKFAAADDHALRSLILLCVSLQPDCTMEELAAAIREKAPKARDSRQPFAYLRKCVVALFTGAGFSEWRAERAAREEQAAAAEEPRLRREREMALELLEDPNVDPEDRRWAEETLANARERARGAQA